MKTLFVFFMAIAAINAFFFSEQSKNDFIQEMDRIFSRVRNYSPNGVPIPQDPPLRMSELIRAIDQWTAISDEEKNSIKNYLFGVKFPRPMPASHHEERQHVFDDEKLKEIRGKWEAMTPEEREEIINNKRRDSFRSEDHVRHSRPMPGHNQHQKPQPHFNDHQINEIHEKWETMTPEEREEIRNNRRKDVHKRFESITPEEENLLNEHMFIQRFPRPIPAHHNERDHPHFDEEKLKEKREKWEAMTLEEREELHKNFRGGHPEIIMRHPRSIQPIKPLPELINSRPYPINIPNTRPFPENHRVVPASDNGRTRPIDSIARPIPERPIHRDNNFQQIRPLPAFRQTKSIDSANLQLSDEERLHELFPNGLPIRPIRPIGGMVIPTKEEHFENDENDYEEINNGDDKEFIQIKPAKKSHQENDVDETPKPRRPIARPAQFQPILPLQIQPIMPIKSQPILPIKFQPILPLQPQPILPL